MVLKNVTQVWQGQEFFGSDFQRLSQSHDGIIGRGKYREWAFTAQRVHQTSSTNCSFKQSVVIAVHNDVHHAVAHLGWIDRNGRHHTVRCVRSDGAIVVIGSFNCERVRAEANAVHVTSCSADVECLWIVPVLTERARESIHIVRTSDIDPDHSLSSLDFEGSGRILKIRCFHYDAFNTARIVLGNQLVPKEEGHQPKESKNFFHFNKVMRREPRRV